MDMNLKTPGLSWIFMISNLTANRNCRPPLNARVGGWVGRGATVYMNKRLIRGEPKFKKRRIDTWKQEKSGELHTPTPHWSSKFEKWDLEMDIEKGKKPENMGKTPQCKREKEN